MPTNLHSITININKLIEQLLNSKTLQESYAIIRKSTIEEQDVEIYRHFNEASYGRNLVFTCSKFDIILMCWKASQESAIHDHGQSNCIMRCLSGKFEEELYNFSPLSKPELIGSRIIDAGDVTYINNDIGLHKIKNINTGESFALHFYFPGIDKCYIFDENNHDHKEASSSFTSKFGLLQSDAK